MEFIIASDLSYYQNERDTVDNINDLKRLKKSGALSGMVRASNVLTREGIDTAVYRVGLGKLCLVNLEEQIIPREIIFNGKKIKTEVSVCEVLATVDFTDRGLIINNEDKPMQVREKSLAKNITARVHYGLRPENIYQNDSSPLPIAGIVDGNY